MPREKQYVLPGGQILSAQPQPNQQNAQQPARNAAPAQPTTNQSQQRAGPGARLLRMLTGQQQQSSQQATQAQPQGQQPQQGQQQAQIQAQMPAPVSPYELERPQWLPAQNVAAQQQPGFDLMDLLRRNPPAPPSYRYVPSSGSYELVYGNGYGKFFEEFRRVGYVVSGNKRGYTVTGWFDEQGGHLFTTRELAEEAHKNIVLGGL